MDDRYIELLLKEFDFSITDPEKEELYAWIEASEANKQTAERMRKAWDSSVDANAEIVLNLDDEYQQVTEQLLRRKKMRSVARAWQIAASVLLIVGLFWLSNRQSSKTTIGPQVVQGPINKHILADGSVIWLLENSKLTYEETANSRQAILAGQGYFEISKDGHRPFEVLTGLGRIRVVGTAFEILMKDDGAMVVKVAEGQVLLSSDYDSINLYRGESGKIEGGQIQKSILTQPAGAWRLTPIVYNQEAFGTIIQQLESDYLIDFDVKDPEILECKLSFTMGYQDISELIAILETLVDVDILSNMQGKYSISGKGCK